MDEKLYCVYSNDFLAKENLNLEHIIPKSLGGVDEFCIKVDTKKNSILGSNVDGKFANDPFVKLKLIKKDYKGHSKKEKVLKCINSSIDNRPVTLTFKKSGLELYDPISKKNITSFPNEVKSSFIIHRDTRIKFIAKVALGAGYFILGENFIKFADHESLRKFIFTKDISEGDQYDLLFYDAMYSVDEKDKSHIYLQSNLINYLGGTNVILQIGQTNIIVDLALDGQYIGSVNFKADGTKIPYSDDIRLGQIINITNGTMRSIAYWNAIKELNDNLHIVDLDESHLDI